MTENLSSRKLASRFEVVAAYLSSDYAVTVFAKLFNAGDIYSYLLKETGPIEAEELDRWANVYTKAESDATLIESLNRYIEALEGKAAAQAELIRELRERLSGIIPQ